MGVKKLKKKLRKMHARILRLNEYHTSATCRVEERVHKLARFLGELEGAKIREKIEKA
jgi:hypothetical protein